MALSGTILKAHQVWIEYHSEPDQHGRLCCKRTKTPLHGRVYHRYRLDRDGKDAPYVALLEGGSGLGTMLSFTGYQCQDCGEHPEVPDHIQKADLVFLKDGIPES